MTFFCSLFLSLLYYYFQSDTREDRQIKINICRFYLLKYVQSVHKEDCRFTIVFHFVLNETKKEIINTFLVKRIFFFCSLFSYFSLIFTFNHIYFLFIEKFELMLFILFIGYSHNLLAIQKVKRIRHSIGLLLWHKQSKQSLESKFQLVE